MQNESGFRVTNVAVLDMQTAGGETGLASMVVALISALLQGEGRAATISGTSSCSRT